MACVWKQDPERKVMVGQIVKSISMFLSLLKSKSKNLLSPFFSPQRLNRQTYFWAIFVLTFCVLFSLASFCLVTNILFIPFFLYLFTQFRQWWWSRINWLVRPSDKTLHWSAPQKRFQSQLTFGCAHHQKMTQSLQRVSQKLYRFLCVDLFFWILPIKGECQFDLIEVNTVDSRGFSKRNSFEGESKKSNSFFQ